MQGIIEPLKSRFHTIIDIEPDADQYVNYLIQNDADPRVCAFLRTHPQEVHQMPKELKHFDPWPNYRTWEGVNRWLATGKDGEYNLAALQGTIGKATAGQFHTFLKLTEKCPDVNKIVKDPDKVPVPDDMGLKHAVTIALLKKANVKNLKNCLSYVARMDRRFEVAFMKDLVEVNKNVTQTDLFVDWVTKNKDIFNA